MSVGNHHATNGAAFERRVMQKLLAEGWQAVWRTAGSKGMGDVDLIATRGSRIRLPGRGRMPELLLVQCKGGATSLSRPAKRRFAAYAASLGARAMVAERQLKFDWLDEDVMSVSGQGGPTIGQS